MLLDWPHASFPVLAYLVPVASAALVTALLTAAASCLARSAAPRTPARRIRTLVAALTTALWYASLPTLLRPGAAALAAMLGAASFLAHGWRLRRRRRRGAEVPGSWRGASLDGSGRRGAEVAEVTTSPVRAPSRDATRSRSGQTSP